MDDEGNETGHHSWLLDIDINGLPYSRIWIRAGYTTTSTLTTTTLHPFGLGPAPVVTGQPSIEARISGCITPYVDASLKGSQSSCTTMGPSCSSKTASTAYLPVFKRPSSNHLSGPWSTWTSVRRAFHPIWLVVSCASLSYTPRLHAMNGGRDHASNTRHHESLD